MKLYFYRLEEPTGEKPKIAVEEREVKEMQIFFRIIEEPPRFYNYSKIMKFEIGDSFSMKGGVVVILLERNAEKAAKIFKRKPIETIETLEREIENLKEKIAKAYGLIDAIDEWEISDENT